MMRWYVMLQIPPPPGEFDTNPSWQLPFANRVPLEMERLRGEHPWRYCQQMKLLNNFFGHMLREW